MAPGATPSVVDVVLADPAAPVPARLEMATSTANRIRMALITFTLQISEPTKTLPMVGRKTPLCRLDTARGYGGPRREFLASEVIHLRSAANARHGWPIHPDHQPRPPIPHQPTERDHGAPRRRGLLRPRHPLRERLQRDDQRRQAAPARGHHGRTFFGAPRVHDTRAPARTRNR